MNNENLTKRGRGRPKGSVNQITKGAKEAFQFAFDKAGGAKRLYQWAKSSDSNYKEFIKLYSKLIPVDLTSAEEKIVIKELEGLGAKELTEILLKISTIINKKS